MIWEGPDFDSQNYAGIIIYQDLVLNALTWCMRIL